MPELPWDALFCPPAVPGDSLFRQGKIVRKTGRPLLWLPESSGAAGVALSLYPAQTAKARMARRLLLSLVRLGLPFGTAPATLRLATGDPFLHFLAQCAGTPDVPEFGILAGNPSTPGTRFIILVFGPSGSPQAVVKAGSTEAARELLRRECDFLESHGGQYPGIPKAKRSFLNERVRAFATEYVYGETPAAASPEEPAQVLGSWLRADRKVALRDLPAWQRLVNAAPEFGAGEPGSLSLSPVVFHGDFAPWNIRASASGAWTVLDWERGEREGIPCWDWFHYVLQPAILVKRSAVPRLLKVANQLLCSDAFSQYCIRAGARGHEKHLLRAYLAYCIHVLRPSEGLAKTSELLAALRG